ncbi:MULTISPECIES: hypothetical protein [Methylobacterium]|uniref:hypothetical protein n=1 Tax=Methylobacterium TaxID=407 RepID=UPI0013EA0F61|nr:MULTISPECIES: hypothetical protein [unclassified Methylobacterium]NGM38004.1 hypothetical protein [Methylobacterium sp. DB0501]
MADFLIAAVEATPDVTMPELAERLLTEHGVTATPAMLSRILCRKPSVRLPFTHILSMSARGRLRAQCR